MADSTRFTAEAKAELLTIVARTQERTAWPVRRILPHLGLSLAPGLRVAPATTSTLPPPPPADVDRGLKDDLRSLERERIERALEQCGGNQSRAAEVLGMPRRTLVRRLAQYGIGGKKP